MSRVNTSVRLNCQKLKKMRASLGYSQVELSRVFQEHNVQVSIASIKRLERGGAVSLRVAAELASFYGVLLDSILAENEDPVIVYPNESFSPPSCIVSIRLYDMDLCLEQISHEIKSSDSDLISLSPINLIARSSIDNLYKTINRILNNISTQFNNVSKKLGCSIVVVAESKRTAKHILSIDEKDLCEVAYLHMRMLDDGVLIDQKLYHTFSRYFDIQLVDNVSIFDKKYCQLKMNDEQLYVGKELTNKTFMSVLSRHASSVSNKLYVSLVGSSGSGKSHWMRYLTGCCQQLFKPNNIRCIQTYSEHESNLTPRISVFIGQLLNLDVNASIDEIKSALLLNELCFEGLSTTKVAQRIQSMLTDDAQHDFDNTTFYDDCKIIQTIIDSTQIQLMVFDGTFIVHDYYTKVIMHAFENSKTLRIIVASSLDQPELDIERKNIDFKTVTVPRLSYEEQLQLARVWSAGRIAEFQLQELVINSNGNLLILRQIIIELIDRSLAAEKLTDLATFKIKELPKSSYDLFGLLVTCLDINSLEAWNHCIERHDSEAKVLEDRGVIHSSGVLTSRITHECYIKAFKMTVSKKENSKYARKVAAIVSKFPCEIHTEHYRALNILYRKMEESNKLIEYLVDKYRFPTSELIFNNSVEDIADSLITASDDSKPMLDRFLRAVQISWFTIVFGQCSPVTMFIEQSRIGVKRLDPDIEVEKAYLFVQIVPLLVSMEVKQFNRLATKLTQFALSEEQSLMLSALISHNKFLSGDMAQSRQYAMLVINEDSTPCNQFNPIREDAKVLSFAMLQVIALATNDKVKAKEINDNLEVVLAEVVSATNQCILLNAQLYSAFELEDYQLVFDKAMQLYDVASQGELKSFQGVAMSFMEWERAMTSYRDDYVEAFLASYQKTVVESQFLIFYPIFANMLAKLNQAKQYRWSKVTIEHLEHSINLCRSKGVNVHLSKLYLNLAIARHFEGQVDLANELIITSVDKAIYKGDEKMVKPIVEQWSRETIGVE